MHSLKFQAVTIPNVPFGKNLINSLVKIETKTTLDLMPMNLIHQNVVSNIIYNRNISNDKSETERKNGSLTAIISLRKLYSARQYHSQIHIPVAIELTN